MGNQFLKDNSGSPQSERDALEQSAGAYVDSWIRRAIQWQGPIRVYAEGFFGLQVHKAKAGKVLFRNLRVKELDG